MRRDDVPTEDGESDGSRRREGAEEEGHDVPEDQGAMEPEVGSTG